MSLSLSYQRISRNEKDTFQISVYQNICFFVFCDVTKGIINFLQVCCLFGTDLLIDANCFGLLPNPDCTLKASASAGIKDQLFLAAALGSSGKTIAIIKKKKTCKCVMPALKLHFTADLDRRETEVLSGYRFLMHRNPFPVCS